MAKENEPQTLSEGNIVEIIESNDENMIGCKGEVITTDPLTIAVVHVLPFETKQVKKIFDAADWDKVRAEAKKQNIKIKGTKDEIVAKINEQHKDEGRVDFKVGQRVEVKPDHSNFPGVRGEVVAGVPRIQVELEGGLGTHKFSAGELTKLPPIL